MLTTAQVYIEALIAFAIMNTFSIIAGFVAAGVTGERTFSFAAAFIIFTTSGAVLAVRLWRMANRTA